MLLRGDGMLITNVFCFLRYFHQTELLSVGFEVDIELLYYGRKTESGYVKQELLSSCKMSQTQSQSILDSFETFEANLNLFQDDNALFTHASPQELVHNQ